MAKLSIGTQKIDGYINKPESETQRFEEILANGTLNLVRLDQIPAFLAGCMEKLEDDGRLILVFVDFGKLAWTHIAVGNSIEEINRILVNHVSFLTTTWVQEKVVEAGLSIVSSCVDRGGIVTISARKNIKKETQKEVERVAA
jgi:cyclopropane fatty-acyl-phospholipid synthase-like methyltransferase